MSRSNITTAPNPASLRRTAFGLVVATALTAFAIRSASAQASNPPVTIRPVVGALLGTGDQHDALKSAVLVGAQAAYAFHPNFGVVGTFGWSPSQDKLSPQQPKLDLFQYDLGIEGHLNDLTPGASFVTQPYASLGGGGRTYNLRDVSNASSQTNALGYGAIGVDLNHESGKFGVRLEARDNVTAFKGFRGELADRKARNDVQLSAGLTFGF